MQNGRQRVTGTSKKPDSVWQISETLDSVDRIVAVKSPDAVWTISQTSSAEFCIANEARRQAAVTSSGRKGTSANLTFEQLVKAVRDVHERLRAQAGRAINVSLIPRNWLIGAYIAEYELRGADRASYNLLRRIGFMSADLNGTEH